MSTNYGLPPLVPRDCMQPIDAFTKFSKELGAQEYGRMLLLDREYEARFREWVDAEGLDPSNVLNDIHQQIDTACSSNRVFVDNRYPRNMFLSAVRWRAFYDKGLVFSRFKQPAAEIAGTLTTKTHYDVHVLNENNPAGIKTQKGFQAGFNLERGVLLSNDTEFIFPQVSEDFYFPQNKVYEGGNGTWRNELGELLVPPMHLMSYSNIPEGQRQGVIDRALEFWTSGAQNEFTRTEWTDAIHAAAIRGESFLIPLFGEEDTENLASISQENKQRLSATRLIALCMNTPLGSWEYTSIQGKAYASANLETGPQRDRTYRYDSNEFQLSDEMGLNVQPDGTVIDSDGKIYLPPREVLKSFQIPGYRAINALEYWRERATLGARDYIAEGIVKQADSGRYYDPRKGNAYRTERVLEDGELHNAFGYQLELTQEDKERIAAVQLLGLVLGYHLHDPDFKTSLNSGTYFFHVTKI